MARPSIRDSELPDYTKGEEIFNMVSHIAGGALSIAALVLCVIMAALHSNIWGVVSGAVYGASLIILYAMSSLYHGLPRGTAKKVFRVIDHCSIFLLIAGTYTPYMLSGLRQYRPGLAWAIFGVIWGAAAVGIILNSIDLKRFKIFSMVCYIAMGWCILAAIRPMIQHFDPNCLILLYAGGIPYTGGAILYALGKKKKIRYMHSIFHLFVLAGSILHFFSILLYVL